MHHKQWPSCAMSDQRLCRILEAFMGIEDSSGSDGSQNDDEDDLFADLSTSSQGG